jgi:NTE family protein
MSVPATRPPLPLLLLAACVLAWPVAGASQEAVPPSLPEDPGPERPRIGLVLSGGGARGSAHVGVLKVLEELRVPVDLVVGTSMGAIVGGLYAAGLSPEEMEAWLERADWDELFRDRPSYSELSFRRKREAREFPVPLEVGVGPDGMQLPSGLIAGQKLNAALRSLTYRVTRVSDFDSLAIPFRAVATDLERGNLVVLKEGDLVDAMRASMSAPGVFTPYPVGDRLLVDGGLLRNLPVDVALAMGADVVIAVDVGAPLEGRSELTSPVQLTKQVTRIMTLSGATAQWARLRPSDVLVLPELGDIGATEFDRSLEAVAAGETAARISAHRLGTLAIDEARYRARRDRRLAFGEGTDRVDFVVVGPYSGRSPSSMLERIATRPGALDTTVLAADIDHLYSLGIYERVDYQIRETAEGNALMLRVREKPWGPAYMRFRMSIRDRLNGEGTYSLAAHLLVPQLNAWGAELVGDLEIGEIRGVRAELFQPLGVRGLFYLAPSVEYRTTPSDRYVDDLTVARFRTRIGTAGMEAGMHIGDDVELAARLERGIVEADRAIGPEDFEGFSADRGGLSLRAEYDGLDDPSFPRTGVGSVLMYEQERSWLGADAAYDRYRAELFAATTRGRTTLLGTVMGSTSGADGLPAWGKAGLGGFLLLSGYQPGEVSGNHMLFGRALVYRSLGGGRVYAGFSAEAGNAWDARSEIGLDDLRYSGALVVGLRTPLGPIYLGYGTRGAGEDVTYLVVGQSL